MILHSLPGMNPRNVFPTEEGQPVVFGSFSFRVSETEPDKYTFHLRYENTGLIYYAKDISTSYDLLRVMVSMFSDLSLLIGVDDVILGKFCLFIRWLFTRSEDSNQLIEGFTAEPSGGKELYPVTSWYIEKAKWHD